MTTTKQGCSPKFCLLLKTLLFLLCIYIKRVTAASVNFDPPSDSFVATNETVSLDNKLAVEGDIFDLDCPYSAVIIPKRNANKTYLGKLNTAIITKAQVTWLKNGHPFHRENGNQLLKLEESDKTQKTIAMYNLGESDDAEYTCMLNYTNIPKEAYKFFTLYPSATFRLQIRRRNAQPDSKPIIHEYPQNDSLVDRGADFTFSCKSVETISHQTTYWFKSTNLTREGAFLHAYKTARAQGAVEPLYDYILPGANRDELVLHNVSDTDIGYYGCLIENARGADIKLGTLYLRDVFIRSQMSRVNITLPIISSTVTNTLTTQPPSTTIAPTRHPELDYPSTTTTTTAAPNAHAPVYHFPQTTVAASSYEGVNLTWFLSGIVIVLALFALMIPLCMLCFLKLVFKREKKLDQKNLVVAPIVGDSCHAAKLRQHLPDGICPDIYNIGKTGDGFISGHHQGKGHLMTHSICSQMLDKEKNPSISSNSDEASSWGKSMSSHGDHSRAFYLHTSNTTATTVPMYDHPPSRGHAQLCGAIVQDACIINPTYGFLRPDSDATNWAFPRGNLKKLNKIGEGMFGEVWSCIARHKDDNESLVAVKQSKQRAGFGDRERLELSAEIEIMKSVNGHPNVIKLLHYCAEDYNKPILLIMEYAEKGNLQTYLRSCRSGKKYGCVGQCTAQHTFTTSKELIKFSYHIAKGMEYVASQGIIHRDLASRNILVSKDMVCKVADFGFARRVTDECAYEQTTNNPVPVRWFAPEALNEKKFTSKSDVFSLGILMWEIATLGATPYEDMNPDKVIEKVSAGGRLERPTHCKDEFYNIMANCWLHDPTQRPSFKDVACELEKLLLSENDYIELDQYPEHAYYNILKTAEKEVVNLAP